MFLAFRRGKCARSSRRSLARNLDSPVAFCGKTRDAARFHALGTHAAIYYKNDDAVRFSGRKCPGIKKAPCKALQGAFLLLVGHRRLELRTN